MQVNLKGQVKDIQLKSIAEPNFITTWKAIFSVCAVGKEQVFDD